MRVPPARRDGDEPHAGFHEAPGREGAGGKRRRAVVVADARLLRGEVERLLRLVRAQDVEGLLVEGVEAVHEVAVRVEFLEAWSNPASNLSRLSSSSRLKPAGSVMPRTRRVPAGAPPLPPPPLPSTPNGLYPAPR